MAYMRLPDNPNLGVRFNPEALRDIWFAGGCFWGVQAYFDRIYGVAETSVGYANGKTENPAYETLHETGHAETVQVRYDPGMVSLATLLDYFFRVIDPTSVNRQGNDAGAQYRTGVYYTDEADLPAIRQAVAAQQAKHAAPLATEVLPLSHYYPAEEYHQDYLDKNPGGYCHINFAALHTPPSRYRKPEEAVLRGALTPEQYHVTQENGTEPPFKNPYWDRYDKGIYVDVVTGQPLFVSTYKFKSGCGWPSFSRPIDERALLEKVDKRFGMERTEVRSAEGDSHLGHVFDDGPAESGGLRYCINSAALRFIPLEEMAEKGYSEYIPLVK